MYCPRVREGGLPDGRGEQERGDPGPVPQLAGAEAAGWSDPGGRHLPPVRGSDQAQWGLSIETDRIAPDPNQPRTDFDPEALDRLAASLKTRGQLQPIRVRWDEGEAVYRVVVGERRWRAARLAGINTVACLVVSSEPSPNELLVDQLMENVLREDLKPVEQARAYKTLMEQSGLTQIQLAETLQVAQSTIARALALLNLPASIQGQVDAGELASNLAYEITKVGDPEEQTELARKAAEGRIKRDEIRAKVARPGRGGPQVVELHHPRPGQGHGRRPGVRAGH